MKINLPLYAFGLVAMALFIAPLPASANLNDLLEMSEKADQADKQDFQALLDRANDCTRARNFSCSEEQLRKAAKLANDSRDRQALNSATQNLQAEQQRVKEEALARAERERQIQLAEAQRREEEEQAEERRRRAQREQQQAESSSSNYNAFALGMQEKMDFYTDLNNRHNQHMQNINNIVEQKRAQEEAERRAQERAAAERREQERANQRAAYDRSMQEQRAADEQRAQNERAAREQQAREARAAEERRAQEAERQRQAQINRNQASSYNPSVLAQNTGGGAGNSAGSSRKTGESAQNCVRASVSGETLTFQNRCGEHVFVIWCGDLKYSKEKCGDDGRFYNKSANIEAGGETTAQITGQYQYAACKGGISFGNDGKYRETSNGGVECLKR